MRSGADPLGPTRSTRAGPLGELSSGRLAVPRTDLTRRTVPVFGAGAAIWPGAGLPGPLKFRLSPRAATTAAARMEEGGGGGEWEEMREQKVLCARVLFGSTESGSTDGWRTTATIGSRGHTF